MFISIAVSEILPDPSVHVTLKLYLPVATIVVAVLAGIIISIKFISCCLTPEVKLVADFV